MNPRKPRLTPPTARHAWKNVRPLDQIGAEDSALAGGKAATLARLARAGFPVLRGFCVLASAQVLAAEKSGGLINAIPAAVRAEIEQAYAWLAGDSALPLIVRSSALAEDGGSASYAGQYRSVSNVRGFEALLDALLACWNAISTPAAAAYAAHVGEAAHGMAVLVQPMLNPQTSGVCYTLNPRTGNRRQMLVEWALHSPTAVEQGTLNPARLVVEKPTGRVLAHLSSAAAPAGMPLHALARTARRIERMLGTPQDIEWAVQDGRLWILQSRPITGVQPAREVWTRANAGEILPGVVTPLTWSVFAPLLARAGWHAGRGPLTLHWRWQHPAERWGQSPALFDGRAYMELHSVYASFASFPGVDAGLLQKALGFEFSLLAADEFPERRPRWHPVDLYRWLRYGLEMTGITRTLQSARQRLERRSARLLAAQPDSDPEQWLRHADRLEAQAARVLAVHITCTAYAFSAYGLLLGRLSPGPRERLESELVTGAQEMTTARHMRAIWQLAETLRECPPANEILLHAQAMERFPMAWQDCPAASAINRQWQAFLGQFGSRSTQEFELAVPRWAEDPALILAAVQAAVEDPRPDPAIAQTARQAQLQEQIAGLDAVSRRLYRSYAAFVPLRENLKHDLVCLFAALRQTYLRLGRELQERNMLDVAGDVFFLERNEISAFFTRHVSSSLREQITRRKALHQTWVAQPVAPVFARQGEQILPLQMDAGDETGLYHGIGCSGGVVHAPAWVLKQLDGNQTVPAGRILVAASIDPGLTPLLLNAAGLVTEVGGMLSHGATLAREFGLPTVCGVPGITAAVRDGQPISVNGFLGTVQVHPLEGEKRA